MHGLAVVLLALLEDLETQRAGQTVAVSPPLLSHLGHRIRNQAAQIRLRGHAVYLLAQLSQRLHGLVPTVVTFAGAPDERPLLVLADAAHPAFLERLAPVDQIALQRDLRRVLQGVGTPAIAAAATNRAEAVHQPQHALQFRPPFLRHRKAQLGAVASVDGRPPLRKRSIGKVLGSWRLRLLGLLEQWLLKGPRLPRPPPVEPQPHLAAPGLAIRPGVPEQLPFQPADLLPAQPLRGFLDPPPLPQLRLEGWRAPGA